MNLKIKHPLLVLVFLVIAWGLNLPICKVGLMHMPTLLFIQMRMILAAVMMLFLAVATGNFVIPRKRDLPVILVVSFFQIALTLCLSNFGLSLVGAGKSSFLIFTTSVWVIPLGLIWGKKMGWMEWVSLLMGAAGVVLFIYPFHEHLLFRALIGDFALVASSLTQAVGIMAARHMKWHRPPIQIIPWQLLFATLCILGWGWVRGSELIPQKLDLLQLSTLVYSGIIATAVGYWAMVFVSVKLRPSETSLGLLWVPIISMLVSWWLLKEPFDSISFLAAAVILGGILLHIYSDRQQEKQEQLFKEIP